MDFQKILQQSELSKQAVEEMKNQTRNFEQLMQHTVKNAPKEHQQQIEQFRVMATRAMNLAKQGKGDEAQQLIKDFDNGRTN